MNGLSALVEREKPFSITTCFPAEKEGKYVAKKGNVAMIFEGKLFNRNHSINACFDADIALELFIQSGTQSFALLDGYWSLIVVDADKQKIYAARDCFGNHSLYYCKTGTYLCVSSEIKPLFTISKEAREIGKNAVFDFLFWGNIGKHSQNLFSNIQELKPSCYLSYSLIDNTFEEKSYYILPYKNCKGGYNEYEEPFYIDKTRQLVIDTVQNNIDGKDKIAIGFGDEMNSSTLLCCARKLNRDIPITAFLPTDLQDDREIFWAENVSKQANADLVKVPCDSQLIIKQLEEINRLQNMPACSPNSVVQYQIMATAKQYGFDAVMDEHGGNELFAGYSAYFLPFLKSLRTQWMFKDWGRELLLLRNSNISYKELLFRKTKPKELAFLNKEYKNDYLRLHNDSENKSVLNDYLHESYTIFLASMLRCSGHVAASLGLDFLTPFSNSKALAEYIFSVPSTFKIHNGWNKYLLRASMVGIVPDEIRWRKQKSGSYLSENKYLNEIGNEIKKQIHFLEDTDNFIDKNALLKEWDNLYKSGNLHFQQFAFRYYSYLVWRNEIKQ